MGVFKFFKKKPKEIFVKDLDFSFEFDEADSLLPDALVLFLNAKQVSTSLLQRKLKLGYSRACTIMRDFEAIGIISPYGESNQQRLLLDDINIIKEKVNQYHNQLVIQAAKEHKIQEQIKEEKSRYKAPINLEMSKEDLFNLIGEPDKIEESVSTKKKIEKCYYGEFINRLNTIAYSKMVKLENGKVVGWKDL